jgi:protein arginine N-methyltransferase 1
MKNKKHKKFSEYIDNSKSTGPCGNILVKKSKNIVKSSEPGFTGDPSRWFNNDEYYKNLQGKSDILHEKDYYFNSYSTFYIHEEMIKDSVRTGAYKEAIEKNAEIFKDKIVLDIGCGTGILSIFAAKAGAKHVYGIEFADIADYAKEIIKQNNLSDKITILKSKVEETELPVSKVDIIISEWMGYFLIYESMLDTVLYARDKWLNKDGYILPDRARIYLAAIEDGEYKKSKIDYWDNVYGFNMSCIKNTALAEPLIDVTKGEMINSTVNKIFDIDLYTVTKEELDFSAGFDIEFMRDDNVHGLITWFDVVFEKMPYKVTLPTGPFDEPTHWKQVIFYMEKELTVKKGDKLSGNILAIKDKDNYRFIDVKIGFNYKDELKWYQLYKIT